MRSPKCAARTRLLARGRARAALWYARTMQHARSLLPVCALCVTACTFEPSRLAGDPAPPPDAGAAADAATPDAAIITPPDAIVTPPDAAVDAGPRPFCDAADPELVGCFRFEDTTDDASGAALSISATDVGFDQGISGRAAVFTAESELRIAETAALDVGALTIEMWVRPDALPADPARAALLDNSGQYSVFVFGGATVRCSGNGEIRLGDVLTVGAWTHVACVHDGQSITLYIDGVARLTGAAGALSPAGTGGSNIGSDNPGGDDDFIGRIDELRIFRRARTADEVCEAAGCTAPAAAASPPSR